MDQAVLEEAPLPESIEKMEKKRSARSNKEGIINNILIIKNKNPDMIGAPHNRPANDIQGNNYNAMSKQ